MSSLNSNENDLTPQEVSGSHLTPRAVADYYWDNIDQLNPYAYFHFVTRLALVGNHERAHQELDTLYEQHLHQKPAVAQVEALRGFLMNHKPIASAERRAYLAQYPKLRPFAKDAFSVLFAQKVWGLDLTEAALSEWSEAELKDIAEALLADPDAVFSLATYALNFLFLAAHFSDKQSFESTITSLYDILESRWEAGVATEGGIQTITYFITHMIINDSLFYTRDVPAERRELHTSYLRRVEALIEEKGMDVISVDCHCELQLCFGMLGEVSKLRDQAKEYVTQYQSAEGIYITEPDLEKDLSQAEHTNVLYILAFE